MIKHDIRTQMLATQIMKDEEEMARAELEPKVRETATDQSRSSEESSLKPRGHKDGKGKRYIVLKAEEGMAKAWQEHVDKLRNIQK